MDSVNLWAWTGEVRFAVTGVAVGTLTMMATRMRANRRRLRQEAAELELSKRAEAEERTARRGQHGQVAERGGWLAADSGAGAPSQDDGLDVSAMYSEAADLDRKGREEAAIVAYLEVVSRYGLDPTPTAVKLTERSARRLRGLGH